MRIDAAFPSQYIKASDLQGRRVLAKMKTVVMEKVGNDQKPVLYFMGKDKGLVLNKTNATKIAEAYGPNTEAWVGHLLELFETMVEFQGDTVAAVRVSVPRAAPQAHGFGNAPAATNGNGHYHAPAAAPNMTAYVGPPQADDGWHTADPGTLGDDSIPF